MFTGGGAVVVAGTFTPALALAATELAAAGFAGTGLATVSLVPVVEPLLEDPSPLV